MSSVRAGMKRRESKGVLLMLLGKCYIQGQQIEVSWTWGPLVIGQGHLFFSFQVKLLKSPNSLLNGIYKQI